ncbi:MAG: PEP-CTERM sorting domain-containing protein [Undibacterium sp.]|uniref:PEP-CTERM sorting domain-containing protein n=1 Tax=Undibacterium sp. TaxID=1914977 RepID=UPI00271D3F0C|nr:PEP-CTERM sorting domain-containing protein [Undibacterium sp.]MDO8654702.1 PEP-CTERM sorting domain-containing protein [Undibacterium sp.]
MSIAVSLVTAMSAAQANTINFTTLRSGFVDSFESLSVDPSNGKVYERTSFQGGTAVRVYANMVDFAAATPSSTLNLAPQGFYGTYSAVRDGQLYGRSSNGSNSDAMTWSTTTGTQTSSISGYAGMGGINGTDTFNWGGYSGVNFMQDSTGLYVVGGAAGAGNNNWQIETLGTGLNSVSSTVFSPAGSGSLGYGFIINGTLFTGASFSSNNVTNAINVDTGAVSIVNNNLLGLGSSYYLSDFSYNYASDTLYAYNTMTRTFYQAANASVQFGVPAAVIPEPGTLILLGLGLAGLGFSRRKRAS